MQMPRGEQLFALVPVPPNPNAALHTNPNIHSICGSALLGSEPLPQCYLLSTTTSISCGPASSFLTAQPQLGAGGHRLPAQRLGCAGHQRNLSVCFKQAADCMHAALAYAERCSLCAAANRCKTSRAA